MPERLFALADSDSNFSAIFIVFSESAYQHLHIHCYVLKMIEAPGKMVETTHGVEPQPLGTSAFWTKKQNWSLSIKTSQWPTSSYIHHKKYMLGTIKLYKTEVECWEKTPLQSEAGHTFLWETVRGFWRALLVTQLGRAAQKPFGDHFHSAQLPSREKSQITAPFLLSTARFQLRKCGALNKLGQKREQYFKGRTLQTGQYASVLCTTGM